MIWTPPIRMGGEYVIDGISDAFTRRGFNVPPAPDGVAGLRGYVEVQASDAVVEVEHATVVDLVTLRRYYLVAPGEPAILAIDRYGHSINWRARQLTTYRHDPDGMPIYEATPEGHDRRITIAWRPDGEPPPAPWRQVAHELVIPGSSFTGAPSSTIASRYVGLGPPGSYELLRLVAARTTDTGAQASTMTLTAGFDAPGGSLRLYTASKSTATTVVAPQCLPNDDAVQGGDVASGYGYSPTGWAYYRLVTDVAPASTEVYTIRALWRRLAVAQLPPSTAVTA